MSLDSTLTCVSVESAADFTAADYYPVKLDASGKAVACSAAADIAVGVLQNKPAVGAAATVAIAGISKVRAAGTIAAGARVVPNAAGCVTAATGNASFGIAMAGGVSGDIIPVLLAPNGHQLP